MVTSQEFLKIVSGKIKDISASDTNEAVHEIDEIEHKLHIKSGKKLLSNYYLKLNSKDFEDFEDLEDLEDFRSNLKASLLPVQQDLKALHIHEDDKFFFEREYFLVTKKNVFLFRLIVGNDSLYDSKSRELSQLNEKTASQYLFLKKYFGNRFRHVLDSAFRDLADRNKAIMNLLDYE